MKSFCRNRGAGRAAAAWLIACFAVPVVAQEAAPLGSAVPDDVHFYVHGMTSRTPDPSWVSVERAMGMLAASGIHEDILDLVTLDMPPGERKNVRATVDAVLGAFAHVDWSLLFEREIAFAERVVLPMPEYIYLFRVPAEAASEQVGAIRAMFQDMARLIGEHRATVRDVERGTVGTMTTLQVEGMPTLLSFGRVDDVLLVSTSTRLLGWSMQRLATRDARGSLAASPGFQASLGLVPEPTESMMYLNVAGLHAFALQGLRMIAAGTGGQPEVSQAVELATAVLEELDVVDHLMQTTISDGTTVESTMLVRMKPDYADMRIAKVFGDRQPWRDWYRWVPEDATSFWFDPGFDPAALLDFVVEIVDQAVLREPGAQGPPALRQEGVMKLRGRLDRISGEMAGASFPSAGPHGCAAGETVVAVRLDDPQGVSEWLRDVLQRACGFLESRGQAASVESRGEMHVVELGAFPWLHPTIGVHEGVLYFATSPAAVEKMAGVARGEQAGIRGRERFASLGMHAPDTVMSLAYGEVDVPPIGFPDLVSALGFGMSLIPEQPDTRPLRILGRIFTKLAPALRELSHGYTWGREDLPSPEPGVFLGRTVYRHPTDM